MLKIKDLSLIFRRDGRYVLRVPSFQISAGQKIAIVGESGSGKSTILDMIGMVLCPEHIDSFQLKVSPTESFDIKKLWKSKDLDSMSDLRRKYIGYVLQTGGLFPFLDVKENILLTAKLKQMDEDVVKKSFDSIVRTLHLDNYLKRFPKELSVGQRQRVAIARAVCHQPKLILADEPTAALDPDLAEQVMDLFLEVIEDTGAALVLVSHDISLVDRFGFQKLQIRVRMEDTGDEKKCLAELEV